MADLLSIGVTGLLAAQRGLTTTSHNVANANTEGYTRQRVDTSARPAEFVGGAFIGTGVQVTGVQRVYDQFLNDQVRTYTSLQNQNQAFHDLAIQVDDMLADVDTGLIPAMDGFFNAVQDMSADPASTPTRQVTLSQAESLTTRFNDMYRRLDDLRQGANSRLETLVSDVNSLAEGIADINRTILLTPKGAGTNEPNDLLDQRNRLVEQLSEYVSLRTVEQDDGTLSVFVGNGQSMVVGTKAQQLDTVRDPYDPTRLQIGYVSSTGASVDVTSQITGGKLGGTLAFRREVLDPAFNGLGRAAVGLAETFNAQHRLGQDLDGDLGGDFFSIGAPEVLGHSSNTGSGVVSASVADVADLTTSNYRLERNGSDYTLTRLSDGSTFDLDAMGFPGSSVTVEGLSLSLDSGTIADGDQYLLRPTRTGAEDIGVAINNTNDIAAAAPVRSSGASANTGTGEISAGTVDGPTPDPNLQQTVTITFNSPPTTFDVNGTGTGNPSGVAYTSGGDISYNGWTVQISGSPSAGDTFTIEANTNGVGDNRNAVLLAGVQQRQSMDGGASTVSDAYGAVVSEVGTRTRQSELAASAQQLLVDQTTASRASVSGVNLDEEAANLVKLQQLYQATAQVISVGSRLFESVLSAVGR